MQTREEPHAGDERETFDRLLSDWASAIVANDPEAIGSFAELDWVLVGETGIFPREQFLESVATGRVTHDTMSHQIHDLRLLGDVAIVITRTANSGSFEGEPFTLDEWTTDVFIRRGDQWRCSLTHLTSATEPC